MIALFTLLYALSIWLIYVRWRIKPTPTNIAISAAIGCVAVGLIVILWQFSSPTSSQLVVSRYTIQLVPQVRGPIEKLGAEPNVPLEKGKDILFAVQKELYEIAVKQAKASLAAANKTVEQMQAGVQVAAATIREAEAQTGAALAEFEAATESEGRVAGAISKVELTQLGQRYAATQASLEKAKASQDQASLALEVAERNVESAEADLENAEFNLERCTVYAPSDGFVTNWQVREGAMAVPLPLAPLGTFVDTSQVGLVASFGQNVLKNVNPGDRAEFAFKSRPGEVLSGSVQFVIQASGEGQFLTSGRLGSASSVGSRGQFAVRFELDDDEVAQSLAMGTAGMAAIYTDVGSPFHVISKVTIRVKAWMYYLIPM